MIIGIDPGKTGAICFYTDENHFRIMDTFKHTTKDIELLKFELEDIEEKETITHIYSEKPFPMIGEGRQSILSYGETYGIVKGVMMYAFPEAEVVEIHPRTWKSFFKLSKDKKESLRYLEKILGRDIPELFGPKGGFKDGRTDALLIAMYGDAIEKAKLKRAAK